MGVGIGKKKAALACLYQEDRSKYWKMCAILPKVNLLLVKGGEKAMSISDSRVTVNSMTSGYKEIKAKPTKSNIILCNVAPQAMFS